MSKWIYINENGERVTVSGGELKGLAKAGLITPETIVETEDGKKARAGKVKGLTFATPAPPETMSSTKEDIYGLAPPPSQKPSTAVSPIADAPSVITKQVAKTSFGDTIPEETNPFTAPPPVSGWAIAAGMIGLYMLIWDIVHSVLFLFRLL